MENKDHYCAYHRQEICNRLSGKHTKSLVTEKMRCNVDKWYQEYELSQYSHYNAGNGVAYGYERHLARYLDTEDNGCAHIDSKSLGCILHQKGVWGEYGSEDRRKEFYENPKYK